MCHQVQLSPAASHRPTAVLDPAWHAAEPPACRTRCPYSPGRTGHVPDTSTSADPICTGIFHTSAKDSLDKPEDRQTGPIRAVLPRSRHLSAGRPDSGEEEAPRGHRGHLEIFKGGGYRIWLSRAA
jgi:hypothetical protein